jgi:transcriptional regulator with PAS, ATPase and Fis domain
LLDNAHQPTAGNLQSLNAHGEPRVAALIVAGDAGSPSLVPHTRVIGFQQTLLIGRRTPGTPPPDGGVWVVRDGRVSSVHAMIEYCEDHFELRDLGSRNGTMVDGTWLTKPVRLREGSVICLGQHVAVFRTMTQRELEAVQRELASPFGPVPLVSPVFVAVTDKLRRLALGPNEILLVGETGVGKEVYARAIHEASGRPGQFVAVNCAAIPRELVESELFGYVRGAHSQARDGKPGLIEEAADGTLFLDEIGEMSPELQSKLLRFIQDRMLWPVGGVQPRKVEVRILAATNRMDDGAELAVRLDLRARLGSEPMRLPALREHVEDLGALAAHFLRSSRRRLTAAAFRALCLHRWPGNVRELEKVLQEGEVLSRGCDRIDLHHLPARLEAAHRERPCDWVSPRHRPPPTGAELEALLRVHQGNVSRVARDLDRQAALVYRWLLRYQLDPDAFRGKS